MACGCEPTGERPATDDARRRILYIALVINALMFAFELGAGLWAGSTALQADSVDMLMDALGFAISLFAVSRGARARAMAGLSNATLEGLLGLAVLAEVGWMALSTEPPAASVMMIVASIALAANTVCGLLLMRFRRQDINMRAIWLCTRNDAIGNAGTIVAGAMVFLLHAKWPDLVMATAVGLLIVRTSAGVFREALRKLRSGVDAETGAAHP